MSLPVRLVGTTGRNATYKVEDRKVDGGEAAVVVYFWEADQSTNAHCTTCGLYKCQHADAALRFHKLNPPPPHR